MLQQPEISRSAFLAELKFEGDGTSGQITGYGAVFSNLDLNGDMLMPGAFDATLAEQKAAGRVLPMFGEHSFAFLGGDPYPIGYWTDVTPDAKGLRVTGELVGLEHPDVSRVHTLLKKKVIGGLSIAFRPKEDGATKGAKGTGIRRHLNAVDLYSIDVVGDPANPQARVESVKSMLSMPNTQAAADAIASAHAMCAECMTGGDAPTRAERDQIMGNLSTAHQHLTGDALSATMMRFDQLREFKRWLHLPVDQGGRGFSNSQADELATLIFKSMPRDEDGDAIAARKAAVGDIARLLSGFSLKFGD